MLAGAPGNWTMGVRQPAGKPLYLSSLQFGMLAMRKSEEQRGNHGYMIQCIATITGNNTTEGRGLHYERIGSTGTMPG